MGRPRNRIQNVPGHIDAKKLPKYCYWDKSGNGHWYTVYTIDGKPHRAKIGSRDAQLSDLHKAIEQRNGTDVDCLNWLWGKFKESVQYTQVSKKTQKDWKYCASVIERHPSKIPGLTVGKAPLGKWSAPQMQKLIDQIAAANGPSAAAHCYRYLRRLCNWSVLRGYLKVSPLSKMEMPKERKLRRLPTKPLVSALITFGQERSALPAHAKGSCMPYVWMALVLAYRIRLRGVEVFDLTDASLNEDGMETNRRKGSNDNVTRWTPELKLAIAAAQAARSATWKRLGSAIPLQAEKRLLLVNQDGTRIKPFAWQNAWKRFLALAIDAGVMSEEERFGLHDLKRRGITDTKGGRAAKLQGGGHKSESMLDVYDFEVPHVDAAGE